MSSVSKLLGHCSKVLVMAINAGSYPDAVALAVGDISSALHLVATYLEAFQVSGDKAVARKYLDLASCVSSSITAMPHVSAELTEALTLAHKTLSVSMSQFQTEVFRRMTGQQEST